MLFPYWLWLTAAGTFLPVGANDYNLFFLPLAALIVWDRRDPLWNHVLMVPMLLWWQPFQLPIHPGVILLCKLTGLYAAGCSLVNRAREQVEHAGIVPLSSACGSADFASFLPGCLKGSV